MFALTHASCFGDVRYVGGVKRRARVISVLKGKFVVLSARDRCRLRQHLSSISVSELEKNRKKSSVFGAAVMNNSAAGKMGV